MWAEITAMATIIPVIRVIASIVVQSFYLLFMSFVSISVGGCRCICSRQLHLKMETLLTMAAMATIAPARIVIASIMRGFDKGYTK